VLLLPLLMRDCHECSGQLSGSAHIRSGPAEFGCDHSGRAKSGFLSIWRACRSLCAAAPDLIVASHEIESSPGSANLAAQLDPRMALSLAAVTPAGLVGANRLGAEVMRRLSRIKMGLGLMAGLAILAVNAFLDRISRKALD
jgi:hypothetical protein